MYVSAHIARENPTKTDSGHLKFVATGVYTYGVREPEKLTTGYAVAPFILAQVKATFPNGLPEPSVAADPIWWAVRKAKASPVYASASAGMPATADRVFFNGVPLPTA